MDIISSVLLAAVGFVLGQLAQQFVFEPIKAFKEQRADAIYFAVRFGDLVNDGTRWDNDDKEEVRKMRASLLQSMHMIPWYDVLSAIKIFGLPSSDLVERAANDIGYLAKSVDGPAQKGEPSDLALARNIAKSLRTNIKI